MLCRAPETRQRQPTPSGRFVLKAEADLPAPRWPGFARLLTVRGQKMQLRTTLRKRRRSIRRSEEVTESIFSFVLNHSFLAGLVVTNSFVTRAVFGSATC